MKKKSTRKKLIEVSIPLKAINAAAVKEKSIRHGHPSTLHLWWARRPLAACRAVLFAQLVDDPSSLPDEFPTLEAQEAERKRLFAIIKDLVKWENSTDEGVLERARAEIQRSCGGELPPVHDPFSGGGSIPLEAQRLGLPAYGSDLNPVAVMIGKAMIEIPPKFRDREPVHSGIKERSFYHNADGLAEDVKFYGAWMREKAFERIGYLYPHVDLPKEYGGGKATVIAWIWTRTVPSPDPAFSDAQVPITSSFLLSSKAGKEVWINPIVDRQTKTITYRIQHGGTKSEIAKAKKGTKAGSKANFSCLLSGTAIVRDYIKRMGKEGRIGESLIAIVAESKEGRRYLEPNVEHVNTAFSGKAAVIAKEARETFLAGETPARLTGGTCHGYGLDTWGKLFTDRQLVALNTFSDLVHEARAQIETDALVAGFSSDPTPLRDGGTGAKAYGEAVSVYLGFATCRAASFWSSNAMWVPKEGGFIVQVFTRQAIPMIWDYAEANPFSPRTGCWEKACIDWIVRVLNGFVAQGRGNITHQPAQTATLPKNACISTDPPYYGNIAYADLSDFFYAWQKKANQPTYPEVFDLIQTPKSEELVAAPYRHGSRDAAERFFLDGMSCAISNMAAQSSDSFPATIYYAFKQSEITQEGSSSTGWATFLQAVIEAGYSVVGTWPLRTERPERMNAKGTNALANSVVLVCRKKEATAETITRAEFIRALKRELPLAIKGLQAANIAPADMPQSAIGPGIGVFSRCKAVLEADDSPMSVKTALQLINVELDEYLCDIQGDFDADTRFAINWFEQHGMKAGDYGSADNLARARGISVDSVKHSGIVESVAGNVRLLSRDELEDEWEPSKDDHLTVWECLQHLVRLHERDGLSRDTIRMMRMIGDKIEPAKDLAYCLYDISADKRKDAKEATAYNAIIADWAEMTRQAAMIDNTRRDDQVALEL